MKKFEDAILLITITVLCLWQYESLDPVNIALLYILPVLLTAIRRGSAGALVVSLLSIVLFNFLFVPPRFSLSVAQPHFLSTFIIIIVVGQVVAYLANEARKAKELEISEVTKDAILSSLSHELRTPLSAVMGASSSLLDPQLKLEDEQKKELIESIHEGSVKIKSLIENLLNMARLENGKLKPDKQNVDPLELVGTVVGKLEYETAKKIKIKSVKYRNIDCDAKLVELALSNILENGIKYGSNIVVEINEDDKSVFFEISNDTDLDDGHDISAIFTKFGRLINSKEHSGIGLGLAICKAIADIHHGKIEARISNGRFFIKLNIPWTK